MLHLQPVQLDFVRLVLRLLLQAARARRQLVLLLARLGARVERQLGHGRYVVDHTEEFVQLAADRVEFARVRCQVVAVALARLSAVLLTRGREREKSLGTVNQQVSSGGPANTFEYLPLCHARNNWD